MGNKTTKKKKHTQPGQTDRRIRGAILVLVILILCVAAYGISTLLPKGAGKKKEAKARPEITSVIIGDTEGTIEKVDQDAEDRYEICATLPIDFPFEKTTLNLELSDGAKVSDASNCILTDLGGRWVVNLTVEDACVVIEAGEQSRSYYFRLDVE